MIIIIAIGIYTATTSHFYHTLHVHTYLNHSSTPADCINGTGTDLYITAFSCFSYLVFHVFFYFELYYYLYSALKRMCSRVKHFTVCTSAVSCACDNKTLKLEIGTPLHIPKDIFKLGQCKMHCHLNLEVADYIITIYYRTFQHHNSLKTELC